MEVMVTRADLTNFVLPEQLHARGRQWWQHMGIPHHVRRLLLMHSHHMILWFWDYPRDCQVLPLTSPLHIPIHSKYIRSWAITIGHFLRKLTSVTTNCLYIICELIIYDLFNLQSEDLILFIHNLFVKLAIEKWDLAAIKSHCQTVY